MRVAIFKPGTHTSAQGKVKTYTAADCEKMVELYNEQPADERHDAPAVIGHPKDNAPAYGWVSKLEFDGSRLYAHVKPTAAEFTEWLGAGFYKKVSPSFYSDGKLRHVGFLGAQPPAIKGLEQFQFADGDEAETYEYSDYRVTTMSGLWRRFREWIISKDGIEAAEQVVPNDELDQLLTEPYDELQWIRQDLAELRGIVNTHINKCPATQYSESDPMNGKTQGGGEAGASKEQQQNLPDDYAELKTTVAEQGTLITDQKKLIDDQSKVIADLQSRNQDADFREFLAGDELKGRVVPGNHAVAMKMLKRAAELEGEFDYTERDESKKGSALDACKAEIREWPVKIDFSEVATGSRANGSKAQVEKTGFQLRENDDYNEESRELTLKVKQVMKERNITSFNEAATIVLAEVESNG